MNNKWIAMTAAFFVLVASIGLISAHAYDGDGYSEGEVAEYREQYKEMLDLHKQYFNSEISFDEFWEMMGNESHYEDMPCHSGYEMIGSHMMG